MSENPLRDDYDKGFAAGQRMLRRQLAERAGNLLTISQMRNSEEATTENLQAHNAAVAALQALARGEERV